MTSLRLSLLLLALYLVLVGLVTFGVAIPTVLIGGLAFITAAVLLHAGIT